MRKYVILVISALFVSALHAGSLRVTANPSQRSMSTMVTDVPNQRIILFGGQNYPNEYFNDLWALDLNTETWKLISVSGASPAPRRNATFLYDSINSQAYLFGGRDAAILYNDVWILDLTPGSEHWTQLFPSGTRPTGCTEAAGVIDQISNRLIFFGGDFISERTNEAWELDLKTLIWSQLFPSGAPPSPRSACAAVYDQITHSLIVFSGLATPVTNDVWALRLTYGSEYWQQLYPGGAPPQERGQSFCAFDQAKNEMVTGFGYDYPPFDYLSDVWALDLGSLAWRQILSAGIVQGRRGSCAAYNPLSKEVVIFGGDYGSSFANTYSLATGVIAIKENQGSSVSGAPYIKLISNPTCPPCQINAFVPFPSSVALKIFDASGRYITTLIKDERNSGNYIVHWDGKDEAGNTVAAGTYFVELELDGVSEVEKLVVIE